MQITEKPGRFRRRSLAFTVAAIATAGCITTASAGPAAAQIRQPGRSAQPASGPASGTSICLSNSNPTKCAAFDANATINTVLDALSTLAGLVIVWKTIIKGNGDGGKEVEEQAEGDTNGGDTDAGLCLAATGGNVSFKSCSADGTVWIAVPHGDGYYIENRYSYNNGNIRALTVANTNNGTRLYVSPPTPGSWQNWDWFFQEVS